MTASTLMASGTLQSGIEFRVYRCDHEVTAALFNPDKNEWAKVPATFTSLENALDTLNRLPKPTTHKRSTAL